TRAAEPPRPTAWITPAPSLWGTTRGNGIPTPNASWRFFTSPGLIPEAATRMRTSPAPGSGVVISPTTRTLARRPCRSYQAAFMAPPMPSPWNSAQLVMSLPDLSSRPACSVAIDQGGLAAALTRFESGPSPLPMLDVDYQVFPGARAAGQHVSGRRRLERLGVIRHRPGNQPALTR